MRVSSVLLGLVCSISQSVAADGSLPMGTQLKNLTYQGTGCSENSVTAALSIDQAALNLTLTNYTLAVGPDVPTIMGRKNCQAQVFISIPANYTISIWDQKVYSNIDLDNGIIAQYKTVARISGEERMVS